MAILLPLLEVRHLGVPPIPQRALFDNLVHEKAAEVMVAMDEANRRWGRRAKVVSAATKGGLTKEQTFTTEFEMRSARFYEAVGRVAGGAVNNPKVSRLRGSIEGGHIKA